VDPVPDPLLLRKSLVAARIEPGTSGSVARNSAHWTTEAVDDDNDNNNNNNNNNKLDSSGRNKKRQRSWSEGVDTNDD
jgi:hypothetical protein